MRVHWISSETWERVTDAIMEPLAPRDVLWMGSHLHTLVELDSRMFDAGDAEDCIDLDGFMALIAMLATPRPWLEGSEPRAFGRPVEEVNAIGRMVLGEGWGGIGALTLCDPDPAHGALTMSAAGAMEVV